MIRSRRRLFWRRRSASAHRAGLRHSTLNGRDARLSIGSIQNLPAGGLGDRDGRLVQGDLRMLIQVVHCHPLPDSYNHALFCTIVAALEHNGHEVVATDLYREKFDPVMSAAERHS